MFVFTSFGLRSPIVREKLMNVLDTKGKTVLIVPFAGFNPVSCAANERTGLVEFGFDEDKIFACKDKSSFSRSYDYIYVPGGDTFKLLDTMQRLGLMDCVKNAVNGGAVYFGVSAGAELATKNLEYVRFFEDNNFSLTDFEGLYFVSDVIIPHADQAQISEQIRSLTGDSNAGFLRISNDGAVIYKKDNGASDIIFL